MFDQAIKINPRFVYAYNGKGLNIDIITIHRKFTS